MEVPKVTEHELGTKLKEMYENGARKKEAVTYAHLFGIKYAEEIRDNSLSIKEIIKISGIPDSYDVEVNNGIKLKKYVEIKPLSDKLDGQKVPRPANLTAQ